MKRPAALNKLDHDMHLGRYAYLAPNAYIVTTIKKSEVLRILTYINRLELELERVKAATKKPAKAKP